MNEYKITLAHDGGTVVITTRATSRQAAIEIVCKAEGCPECAVRDVSGPPETFEQADTKRKLRNRRARMNRKAREQVMRDCGLVKVRGALGGVYWE